jgi:hypothetical protein
MISCRVSVASAGAESTNVATNVPATTRNPVDFRLGRGLHKRIADC